MSGRWRSDLHRRLTKLIWKFPPLESVDARLVPRLSVDSDGDGGWRKIAAETDCFIVFTSRSKQSGSAYLFGHWAN